MWRICLRELKIGIMNSIQHKAIHPTTLNSKPNIDMKSRSFRLCTVRKNLLSVGYKRSITTGTVAKIPNSANVSTPAPSARKYEKTLREQGLQQLRGAESPRSQQHSGITKSHECLFPVYQIGGKVHQTGSVLRDVDETSGIPLWDQKNLALKFKTLEGFATSYMLVTNSTSWIFSNCSQATLLAKVRWSDSLSMPVTNQCRDNCRCSQCVNQDTMQRAFDTFSVGIRLMVRRLRLIWLDTRVN